MSTSGLFRSAPAGGADQVDVATLTMMPARPAEVLRFLARSSKRVAVTVAGGVLVAAGLAMLALPGPGILVVAVGFAVLGTEYAWAATAFERTKGAAAGAGHRARDGAARAARAAWGAQSTARALGRRLGRR